MQAGHLAGDAAAIPQREHPVQAHPAQPVRRGLDRVDHGHGLGVRNADDELRAGLDVVHHRLGGNAALLEHPLDPGNEDHAMGAFIQPPRSTGR